MKQCSQCEREIDSDSRFCKYCGCQVKEAYPAVSDEVEYAFCAKCGARIPALSEYCLICGTRVGQASPSQNILKRNSTLGHIIKKLDTSITDTSEMELSEYNIPEAGKKILNTLVLEPAGASSVTVDKDKMSRAALAVAALFAIGILAVGFWRLLPYILPGDLPPIGEGIMYVKDGTMLMLSFPDEEPYKVSDQYIAPVSRDESGVKAASSSDGRYIAYANAQKKGEDGYLYLLDLSRLDRADLQPQEGSMIAESTVSQFYFSQRGNYLIYLSSKGGLYGYDYKKVWLIDTDVREIKDVGDRQLIYIKNSLPAAGMAPRRFDVYLRSIAMDTDDKVMIAQNAADLLDWTKNYTSFIYTQEKQTGAAGSHVDVIRYDAKLYQSQTLVSTADVILDVSAEQATVIFARKISFIPRYEQLVDDSLMESDKLINEPTPEEFGLPENYMDIFMEKPDDTYDVQEEVKLQDQYYDEYQGFLKALSVYRAKQERDALRLKARLNISSHAYPGLEGYEVSIYRGNVTQTIDENVYILNYGSDQETLGDVFKADIELNYAAYMRSRVAEVSRLDLSVFSGDGDINIIEYITDNIPRQFCFMLLGQNPAVVYDSVGKNGLLRFEVNERADGIYYITDSEGEGVLSYCGYKNGVLTQPLFIDNDVSFIAESSETFNGSMLYMKNAEGNMGDLYGIKDGVNPVLIAEDISITPEFTMQNTGKSLLYYRRYDLTGEVKGQIRGELYLMTKQERLIVGDVYSYDYRGDKMIYLMRDRDKLGKGALYLYREGGVAPVDVNVTEILKINNFVTQL